MSKKTDIMEMDPPVMADATGRRPILVVTSGRGWTGKSVLLSLLATLNAGRYPLTVIDADPKNGSLSGRYPHAVAPEVGAGEDRRAWIEAQFDRMVEDAGTPRQHDLFLDLGAGDLLLSRWGHEVQLAQELAGSGVDPVLIHTLGPSEQDVSDLADLETDGVFAPQKTIVVLNAGLVAAGSSAVAAFEPVSGSAPVKAIERRGGRVVWLPRLESMADFERSGLRFSNVLEGDPLRSLKFIDRIRVRKWFREEVPAALAPVRDWLPEMVDLSERRA